MAKNAFNITILVFATIILLPGCAANKQVAGNAAVYLKDKFKNDFFIGTAINAQQIEQKDSAVAKLIVEQFNALTLKM